MNKPTDPMHNGPDTQNWRLIYANNFSLIIETEKFDELHYVFKRFMDRWVYIYFLHAFFIVF